MNVHLKKTAIFKAILKMIGKDKFWQLFCRFEMRRLGYIQVRVKRWEVTRNIYVS